MKSKKYNEDIEKVDAVRAYVKSVRKIKKLRDRLNEEEEIYTLLLREIMESHLPIAVGDKIILEQSLSNISSVAAGFPKTPRGEHYVTFVGVGTNDAGAFVPFVRVSPPNKNGSAPRSRSNEIGRSFEMCMAVKVGDTGEDD